MNQSEITQLILWRSRFAGPPQEVNVPLQAWNRYFPDETAELQTLHLPRGQKINISDLADLASKFKNEPSANRLLFVATMMWGRGPKNGRLMPNFLRVANSDFFDETLSLTREEVMYGNPGTAYSRWLDSGIKGIREPFFTKWFFVCGLGEGRIGLQPFTLDSRVRSSLKALDWPKRADRSQFRGKPADFYVAYLLKIKEWSALITQKDHQVSSLDVEQILFWANGRVT